jgi:hypothetical protein
MRGAIPPFPHRSSLCGTWFNTGITLNLHMLRGYITMVCCYLPHLRNCNYFDSFIELVCLPLHE